jgi:hypothetical protein
VETPKKRSATMARHHESIHVKNIVGVAVLLCLRELLRFHLVPLPFALALALLLAFALQKRHPCVGSAFMTGHIFDRWRNLPAPVDLRLLAIRAERPVVVAALPAVLLLDGFARRRG